jgi:hypothetical protein
MIQISKFGGTEHTPLASTDRLVTGFDQSRLPGLALSAFASGGTDFTSDNIWFAMAPSGTRYHVFQYDGYHYVVDFGREVSPPALPAPKVYKHYKPYAIKANELLKYFLISKWITSSSEISKRYIVALNSIEDWSIAVYTDTSNDFDIYSGKTPSGELSTLFPTVVNRAAGNAPTPTPLPATVGGVTGNAPTPTPLPATVGGVTGNGVPQTVSATTLATTPCAGPYSDPINRYNADVLKPPATGKPIACSTAATEAKTKLTVTITPSVPIALGSVTFKDVPMEKKDDVWFGLMMIAPTTASSSQWIQLEVKEQKLSYTACLGQCDTASPKYEQKKDLEVKHDKDKKYKFEGGTVEYTEEDPFHKGMSPSLILGLSIGGSILGFILFVVIAVFVFTNRASVANGVDAITTQMSNARDNAFRRLQSWRGNATDTSS